MTPRKIEDAEHTIVFRDERYFAAWPFSGGLWQFADGEIVAGFTRARADYGDPAQLSHHRVEAECGERVLMRSTDRGRAWPIETLQTMYTRPAFDRKVIAAKVSTAADSGYDPAADGYALFSGSGRPPAGKPAHVFTMVSTDRCRTWSDPARLPTWLPGADRYTRSFATGRPSYVVREDGAVLLFGSASRQLRRERWGDGAAPVVYASRDGGASWGFLAEIELTPAKPMGVTPYPVILDNGDMLLAVRRQYDGRNAFTQVYRSRDGGGTWGPLSRANDWGAPANLVQLPDTRLVCVYGYRQKPYGIRARVSEDRGATWGEELVLRDDGASWDLGYPRTLLLADGALLTVYYFNSDDDPIQQDGGVRHIVATRWRVEA